MMPEWNLRGRVMSDPRATVHALMRGLVTRHFPTQQSAAKEMADFWHPTGNAGDDFDTAALSRKMNGTREWTTSDVIALSAIAGSDRVVVAMRQALPERAGSPVSALQHARRLIKEGGEGTAALLAVSEGGCPHQARAELVDILDTVKAALRDLDASDMADGHPREGA
ncbi:hypothetical protein [Roseivivax isoporae]|uniref:Uncharacterized protein n=1 Tax=Roseivivax isoporae LMG 25204 TaxID=1449351 RepID=X7F1Q9_9RHOB|nr:hypothetical protein [Roseivivax isoporae]ETX26688.1 hypothetical protein RISW2_20650 [Roseivivax isoporae LMG 25204]